MCDLRYLYCTRTVLVHVKCIYQNESSCSGDYVLHQGEKGKFLTDTNSTRPIRLDSVMKRLLPLAANQFGRRGWHFQSFLEELAEFVVCRPTGCRLLQGTFAMSEYMQLPVMF